MKLQYLGTAAAEGFPGVFCRCPACQRARKAGGRNIRTRSQALVDDRLLIDFCPDTYMHVLNYSLDLGGVTDCLITHAHTDHLYAKEAGCREHGYAYIDGTNEAPPLTFYISHGSLEVFREYKGLDRLINNNTVAVHELTPCEGFDVMDYRVTPLKASHAAGLDPLIYIIDDGHSRLLYAHDSGWFPDDTWEYLKKNAPRFDLVSLDCTGIVQNYYTGHMGLHADRLVREKLKDLGCADDKTRFVINHFSHNGLLTYDELLPVASEMGLEVSYDGAEFTF